MNTEIENLKKDINSIVAFLASNTHILIKKSDLIAQIVNRQPTQPEGYQGLNKWYLLEHGVRINASRNRSNGEISGYGLFNDGRWFNSATYNIKLIKHTLTESEKIEAIKKGLEQKGIVEGARVKDLNGLEGKLDFANIRYYSNTNVLTISGTNFDFKVFDNGTFAEVVKEEKPTSLDDKIEGLGQKIDKATDKELLKECYDYLFYVKRKSFLFSQDVVLDVLLARINEVIKPK